MAKGTIYSKFLWLSRSPSGFNTFSLDSSLLTCRTNFSFLLIIPLKIMRRMFSLGGGLRSLTALYIPTDTASSHSETVAGGLRL